MKRHKILKISALTLLTIFVVVMLLPKGIQNPVEGCGSKSYNPNSFWHPWGNHNHRGVDIFAKKGTPVHPAIGGIVVSTAGNKIGGKCVIIFSSGFRFHYYAHLSEINTYPGAIVSRKSTIGKVGDTGNAAGKAAHLHYSIASPIPQGDWRFDPKLPSFYINPIRELEKSARN